MAKTVSIKLTKLSPNAGPFIIYDQHRNEIASDVPRKSLLLGTNYSVPDSTTLITLSSTGICKLEKTMYLADVIESDYFSLQPQVVVTGCIWRHLRNPEIYNTYYGNIEPFIIEHPIDTTPQTEILQNIKDYTRVYQYFSDVYGVSDEPNKIEVDNVYYNKMIVYNDSQCSGVLNLVEKPKHSLKNYMSYPIYNIDSKTITYTKSDGYYNVNTFWNVMKSKSVPMFKRNCVPLSIDKELNQINMEYGKKSFQKTPLRAKNVKVRLILDNNGHTKLVSQLFLTSSQLSYK